ncbi:PREDICTED: uncharacterized protein LOC109588294, partial [Amphimedon queenslandica]|uniref:Uncharacterized protein n=1 Tax=Amphimedon queenslandica TaxID=400682 RepID=A0AAN0JT72_AMPQE
IPLPDSVTGRCAHTVSSFVLDPNHVFLIIVGGYVKGEQKHVGPMQWMNIPVTDPNITMVVELEKRKELNEFMTDKEKELQVMNESLRHDLQVARINNQSLQEALLETQSLSEKRMLTLETQSLETKTLLTKRKRDQKDSPHSDPISVAGLSREATGTNNSSTSDQQNVRQQVESQDSDSTSVQSQLSEATKYAGLVYYEEKGVEDLVTFTGAKKLNALLEFIKKTKSHAEIGLNVYFRIASLADDGYIELNLTAPQDEPFTGWSIKPHMKPCRVCIPLYIMCFAYDLGVFPFHVDMHVYN